MSSSTSYVVNEIDVPDATDTIPLAIDQEGDFAGYYNLDQKADTAGFFEINGKFTSNDQLANRDTKINALSENGWIAGTGIEDFGGYKGFVANTGGTAAAVFAAGDQTFVTGVDQYGDAVGFGKTTSGTKTITTGFVFLNTSSVTNATEPSASQSVTGTPTPLSLPDVTGVTASEVNAISQNGEFIGGDYTNATGQHAFIEDLTKQTVRTIGDVGSSVVAVNNSGQAAGSLPSTTSYNPLFFFNGKTVDPLLDPHGSALMGSVSGMNNVGQVVGYDSTDNQAFVYSGEPVSLIDGPSPEGTSSTLAPAAINDKGEITGFYNLNGTHGFTATPSQPPTLSLAITAPDGSSPANPVEGDTVTATIGDTGVSSATYTFTEVTTEGVAVTVLQDASVSPTYTFGYNLTGGDKIEVSASFTDGGGSETATAETGPLGTADAPQDGTLALSGLTEGNAVVRTPIVATISDPNGNPTGAVTYVFEALEGSAEVTLQSGSSNTLTPTAAEIGDKIKVTAEYTDLQGFGDAPTASAGVVVPAAPSSPTLSLAIKAPDGSSAETDNPIEGDTVTATIGASSVSGAIYTFTDATTGKVLQTASPSSSYTLAYNLTGGHTIEVSASFTDGGGAETATAETGSIGTADAPQAGTLTVSGLTIGNAVVGTPIVATIADPNGNPAIYPPTTSFTFTDLKSGAATGTVLASGASDTLTPTADEIGDTITVLAVYTDAQGFQDKPTASAGIVVAPSAPSGGTTGGGGGSAPAPTVGVPTAKAQSSTTAENTADPILLTGTDPDSPALPLTFAIATQPADGTLSSFNAATGAVTYTPNPSYVGPDSFAFTDSNGTNASPPATVTLAVTPPSTSVVTPPPTNNAVTPTLAFDRTISVSGNQITLSGTTTPGAAVDVFANMGAAGQVDLGPATVDPATGAWTLTTDGFTRGFHDGLVATATLGGVTTTTDSGLDLTTGLGPKGMGFTTILDDYDTASAAYLGSTFIKGGGGIFAKDHHIDLPDGGERYTYTGGSILADQSVSSFSASYIDDGNLTGSIVHNTDGTTYLENDAKYQVVNSHHDDTIVDYGSHTRFIFHDGAGHETISDFKLGSDTISLPASESAHLAKAIQVYDPGTQGFDTTIFTGHGLSITFMGIKKEQLLAHAADFGVHA